MKEKAHSIYRFLVRNKAFTKALSFVLSLVIFFYVIPSTIFAEAAEALSNTDDTETQTAKAPEIENKSSPFEVIELREENVKHFRLEDGSYVAAQYNYPVHYTDENGELKDIDNRLIESGDELSTGTSRVKFVKKITGNGNIFTLHENNAKMTIGLDGARKKVKGVVIGGNNSDDAIEGELGKMTNLENISSTILYEDILDGVDIEYIVHSLNIKENIIVKERKESYSYTFNLELNNLTASLGDNGSVYINAPDSETQYVIPAPIVYDSNGLYAPKNASAYTLSQIGSGKYELTVTVDASWMNSENIEYPIIIDPSIMGSGGGIVDFNINQYSPADNSNGSDRFYVSSTQRAYIKFDEDYFADLPHGAAIVKTELSIISYLGGQAAAKVGAYEITSDWDETLTWNKTSSASAQGTFSETPLDYVIINSNANRSLWNITDLYERWLSGAPNYGIGLRLLDETATNESASFTAYEYHPSIPDEILYDPAILISYIYVDGLENYYPTSTHSAGIGGVGSINLYTGGLTLAIPTLTTTDNLFAFTPTLVYNSSLANMAVTSANSGSAFAETYMPYGFKLNIQETIVSSHYFDSDDYYHQYYVLFDADGTTHRFYCDNALSPNYYDDDGLRLTLTSENNNELTIEDVNHNVKKYSMVNDSFWHLTSVSDMYGNELIFSFNGSYQPTKVIVRPNGLYDIEMLSLLYDDNRLCAVYNESSKNAVILSYSGNNLSSVKYCYGNSNTTEQDVRAAYANPANATNVTAYATASYAYDNNGYITEITDSDDNKSLKYEITDGKITQLSEYADDILGQQISYTYGEGYTDVRTTGKNDTLNDTDDIIARHIFDDYGRATSIYTMSSNGNTIYGAATGSYETMPAAKNSIKETASVGSSSVNYFINSGFENSFIYWTTDGNVSRVMSDKFGEVESYCASFAPTAGSPASIKHKLSLFTGNYTFSMKVNSANAENATATVIIKDTTGNRVISSENIDLNTSSAESISLYTKTFYSIPYSAGRSNIEITVKFAATGAVSPSSVLQIDMMNLEKGNTFGEQSIINMGSFEQSTINPVSNQLMDPYFYWERNDGNGVVTESTANPFSTSAKVTTNAGEDGCIKQRIFEASAAALSAFDNRASSNNYQSNAIWKYKISGFAKAENASISKHAQFCLKVAVTYYQGADKNDVTVEYVFSYVPTVDTWQYAGGYIDTHISASSTTASYECVRSIDVYCVYSGHYDSYAYFDNISVIAEDADCTKYSYNEQGLVTKMDSGHYTEYYDYNENNDITVIANSNNEIVMYDYYTETAADETQTTTGKLQYLTRYSYPVTDGEDYSYERLAALNLTPRSRTKYLYNDYGLITKIETYEQIDEDGNKVDDSKSYYECYTYITDYNSKIFGAATLFWDSTGTNIRYFYDESKGYLLASVNTLSDSGSGLSYVYDEQGRLIKVLPATYIYTYEPDYTVTENAEKVEYVYDQADRIEQISTGSTVYTFTYDGFGNASGVSAGSNTLATYEYNSNNGKIKKINYGNGFSEEYLYNTLEMLSEIRYNYSDGTSTLAYSYQYTSSGQLYKLIDDIADTYTVYRYDGTGKLIGAIEYSQDNSEIIYFNSYTYDDRSRLTEIINSIPYTAADSTCDEVISSTYRYNESNGFLSEEIIATSRATARLVYDFDNFDRLDSVSYYLSDLGINSTLENRVEYVYYEPDDLSTSNRVSEYISTIGNQEVGYSYTYDSDGNITKITYSNGKVITYTYDALGQLTSENNNIIGASYTYTYDDSGNLVSTSKTKHSSGSNGQIGLVSIGDGTESVISPLLVPLPIRITNTYSYTNSEWGDLLTAFNGTAITYDEIGNPLSYYNGSSYTFTWRGRELISAVKGSKNMSFVYNDEGLRVSKTVNGVTTHYIYDGSLLLAEYTDTQTTVYIYDATGSPIGFKYRASSYATDVWDVYWYEKNLQGDIVAIYNTNGTKLVTYGYNAWGVTSVNIINGLVSTTAVNNNLTYRGYYYDTDLGMYYLQSRYYDPAICRFINADAVSYLGANNDLNSYNLFAYCSNNPVSNIDPTGHVVWEAIASGAAIGFVLGFLTSVLIQTAEANGDMSQVNVSEAFVDAIFGALNGALAASEIGACGSFFIGFALGGLSSVVKGALFEGEITFESFMFGCIVGGICGLIAGAGADNVKAGHHVTKFVNSCKILNSTIANGTKSAIAHQADAVLHHAKELIVSGARYIASCFGAFIGAGVEESIND